MWNSLARLIHTGLFSLLFTFDRNNDTQLNDHFYHQFKSVLICRLLCHSGHIMRIVYFFSFFFFFFFGFVRECLLAAFPLRFFFSSVSLLSCKLDVRPFVVFNIIIFFVVVRISLCDKSFHETFKVKAYEIYNKTCLYVGQCFFVIEQHKQRKTKSSLSCCLALCI